MTYLIYISLVSLLLIISMVSYRSYEINRGKELIAYSTRKKSDEKVLTFLDKNIILLGRIYQRISVELSKLPEIAADKMHYVWKVISQKGDLFFDKIRGKRPMNNRGSVSLYWQSVSRSKDSKK